jgi:hypothetical protein
MGFRQREIRLGLAREALAAIDSIPYSDTERALGKQYARLLVLKCHPELENPKPQESPSHG